MRLEDLRRDYTGQVLDEQDMSDSPFIVFESWLEEAIGLNVLDAHCFVLSSNGPEGWPDSRVVLLKGIDNDKFIFYSNYESAKGQQIENSPKVSMNFYWPTLGKQVRILGLCTKVDRAQSEKYFYSRPRESQAAAIVSDQSQIISSRAALIQAYEDLLEKGEKLQCPLNWGGYQILPNTFEFFQGHPNRLHDRIVYKEMQKVWGKVRISP